MSEEINVRQILIDWLKLHGYDGLCGDECGCPLDDLVPCDSPLNCVPGYRVPTPPEYVDEFGEYLIRSSKEPPTAKDFDGED